MLGHIANHEATPEAERELAVPTLHEHFRWSPLRMRLILARLRALQLVSAEGRRVALTERGQRQLAEFRR